jgi:hypothetical protein
MMENLSHVSKPHKLHNIPGHLGTEASSVRLGNNHHHQREISAQKSMSNNLHSFFSMTPPMATWAPITQLHDHVLLEHPSLTTHARDTGPSTRARERTGGQNRYMHQHALAPPHNHVVPLGRN